MNRGLYILVILTCALFAGGPLAVFASQTSGTIVSGVNSGYAWSNRVGWVNFGTAVGNIHVTDAGITGYAWSTNFGWINFSPTNGGVHIAADGTLSGYAWGTNLGWIHFFSVSITSSGRFTGTATGTNVGTLTFDCQHCSVVTDYVPQKYRTSVVLNSSSLAGGNGNPSLFGVVTTNPIMKSADISEVETPEIPATVVIRDVAQLTHSTGNSVSDVSSGKPKQLSGIHLELDNPRAADVRSLGARVTFTDFGSVATQVQMDITILDTAGTVMHTETASTTIETDGVYDIHLHNLSLPSGQYTLRVNASYNGTVKDIYEQSFSISAPKQTVPLVSRSRAVPSFLLVLFMVICIIGFRGVLRKK